MGLRIDLSPIIGSEATASERHSAALWVVEHAHDNDDARDLLAMLGLTEGEP